MNDSERDRSGDGAGPVAPRSNNIKSLLQGSITMLLFFLLLSPSLCFSQKSDAARLRGLSLTVDFGVLKADNFHANFYNGNPDNANTLLRILHSESYGHGIWNNLSENDLISSSIANYNELTVAEYGDMMYKLAIQLGMGFRYDFENSEWGWLTQFNYAKLHAQGLILLNSGRNNSYTLTNQDAYVNCPATGVEERIYIDLGIFRKFSLSNGLDLEMSLGGNVNNTKVESSDVQIGGISYNILDIWNGQSPSSYVGTYEYVNQGGIGYGGFAGISVGFTLPAGTAMSVGYTFNYNKVNLEGYGSFAAHHSLRLNVAINNFSFFDT